LSGSGVDGTGLSRATAPRAGRIAVCVSGAGSNLRALHARLGRGPLRDAAIVLVLADRPCAALEWAREQGLPVARIEPSGHADRQAWDAALAEALVASGPDVVVLAGFMRLLGPATLSAFPGRVLNVHPSLLPAFPGRDAVGEALGAGVRVTGVTVHLVDASLDGGPIVAQEAVPVLAGDDATTLAERLHAVEHRLLPHSVGLALAGRLRLDGRHVRADPPDASPSRRALLSVSDKTGLLDFAAGLAGLGFELVSTGGTARELRAAGLPVEDVASVTGFPEMLDGRVKTLHPRIAAGVLADQGHPGHRAQLAAAAIEPFELLCVNLYRFADAAARPGVRERELIEEIDIGGPTLVRAAAKNHSSVTIVTDPADYAAVLEELGRGGGVSRASRRRLALRAFELTAAYDSTIASVLAARLEPVGQGLRERVFVPLRRVRSLRYGENPHQAAAAYLPVVPGVAGLAQDGPFSDGVEPLAGKELSYNNLLDAAAASRLARDLRGPAVAIVKHTNPCGAAEATDLLTAWARALAGDPVSAFGGVVAVRGTVSEALAQRLAGIFLEVVVAAGFEAAARERLAERASLRLLAWPGILEPSSASLEWRSVGGAVLATEADVAADDPAGWRNATSARPNEREARDLDLAWRVGRHVTSNAIVLARDGSIVGVGAGQMSRVDSARLAVARAGERARGAVCASDAFFPFPDAVEVCLAAGVRAFVQPGGSQRDAEVVAVVEAAGGAMLLTGRRHFRH
jgi:phosphoribosylaminoimidazolecarboxamide formyltransferase / IMP cyclohydrolase